VVRTPPSLQELRTTQAADVQRVHEDGPVVITTGEGRGVRAGHRPFRFAFNDLFTFRDGLIARVDSYVVPLP